jgi:hypothetical protein
VKVQFKTIVALSTLIFSASSYAADQKVECFERNVAASVLSYNIKGAPSMRLDGGTSIKLGAQEFFADQVAQYKATSRELYLVLDDAASNSFPLMRLDVDREGHHFHMGRQVFEGKISIFSNTAPVDVKRVKCKVTAI